MPMYAFLKDRDLSASDTEGSEAKELTALYRVGVPYTKDQIAHADEDMKAQAGMGDATELVKRWPKAQARDFDGDPQRLTEMDALVAYLQVLGTMVDVNSAAAQEDLARETGR